MAGKKIFTVKNKRKLACMYSKVLLEAIEKKEKNYSFDIVSELKRVKKYINPYTCMDYLQGCPLDIPVSTYGATMLIYGCLGIDKNKDYVYADSDGETIDREYWEGMGASLCAIIQGKIKNNIHEAVRIMGKVRKDRRIIHAFNFMDGKYFAVYCWYNKYKVVGTGIRQETYKNMDTAVCYFNSLIKDLNLKIER